MRWTPLAVALLVQAALLLWRLDRLPIWGDEQFTLDVVALPWGEIAETLRRDIHPPLYFALAKLWAALPLPGSEVVRLRAFSALTMLGATVALDRLILAEWRERLRSLGRESPRPSRTRRADSRRGKLDSLRHESWMLAVWALLPAVVLYGRMARSYALQTLLGIAALYAAMRLIERRAAGATRARLEPCATAGLALAALLYTHYLPGLAVAAALAVGALVARRVVPAAVALAVAGLAYLPWAVVLGEGLARAAHKSVYAITGSWLAELPVRFGYALLGLFVGEAHVPATFGFGLIFSVGILAAAARGWLAEEDWRRGMLAAAGAIGFVGAAKWVSFPFMPARLLWLLPWLIPLAVVGAFRTAKPRVGLAVWLALLGVGQVFYLQERGFLNKGYLIPFEEMARDVAAGDLVLADATNCDPSPLRAEVPAGSRFRAIASGADVDQAISEAEEARTVWRARASRDVTPDHVQDELDARLAEAGFAKSETRLLPYSTLDLVLLRAMGEADPPSHHLLWVRYERETR